MTQEKLTPKEVALEVSRLLNNFGTRNSKEFIEAMGNDHRTIQQRFTQLAFDWINHCDGLKGSGRYDDRNKESVLIANKITDFMEKEQICCNRRYILPFI